MLFSKEIFYIQFAVGFIMNILPVVLVCWFFLANKKQLFLEPITGGNGKTQMNELAQWVMTALLVYCVFKIKSDEVLKYAIGLLILGVGAIAGIKTGVFSRAIGAVKKKITKTKA